jgi:hypothetical protein
LSGTACDNGTDREGESDPARTFVAFALMETMMRTLQIEELELVAGGGPPTNPAFQNTQSSKNNGLGNGDQGAPGGSEPNNNAENSNGTGPSAMGVVNFPHTSGFNMDQTNFQPNLN